MDWVEGMKMIDDNSIDAVVTDPPYGLSFMGKKWDYDVPDIEVWKECLRVLKPGGYLLAFAGTRTQHRMAVRIEDAGFEIRDMIAWVYGSGFPKSHNIGKAVDKLQGNEREVVGKDQSGSERNCMAGDFTGGTYDLTKGQSEWEGWGTALKPALEPITVARKPLSEKTVVENVLKWGTGGINIDGCRVEAEPELAKNWDRKAKAGFGNGLLKGGLQTDGFKENAPTGRFPANLIHDGSDEVVELFPDGKSSDAIRKNKNADNHESYACYGKYGNNETSGYSDSGSAARFFYCAKASKSERNMGCEGLEEKEKKTLNDYKHNSVGRTAPKNGSPMSNNHPTVKPIAVMEYLVRLVSRKGSLILDPFAGSGTTGIACKRLERDYILIEREFDYCVIGENRIDAEASQLRLEI